MNWEFALLDFIYQNLYHPVSNTLAVFFTYLGEWGWMWILLAFLLTLKKKYRPYGILMLCSLLITFLVGEVGIKNIVCRVRPCDVYPQLSLLIPKPDGFSFPSGHAASSFTAAVILFHANRKWGVCALAAASLIALSRVYLYVHYPTDVLAGMLLGIAVACMVFFIYRRLQRRFPVSTPISVASKSALDKEEAL